jgi:type IV pilus assembly protein PilW
MIAARGRGFSLPELMISLTLGLLLVVAFLVVVQRCRASFAVNESLARQQDAARHALSVLVPDIELAGFQGLGSSFTGTSATVVGELPSGIHACGTDFATTLSTPVQGSDNTYRLGADARDCAPTASAGGARAGTDTLTVRHASMSRVAPHAGRLQVYSQALSVMAPVMLFADGRAPGIVDPDHEIRDVEVRTYYIANDSVDRPGWPALRVKALTESRGAAQFRDEEILPGVEDLQIEIGVVNADGTAGVTYVSPDSPQAREGPVVSVRLWLRIRADVTESGFSDARTLTYANIAYAPSVSETKMRRMLVERTVALRNVIAGNQP